MRIRWRNFELPNKVQVDESTSTETYARFTVEPFERGFGHTIGNGLRRVLLSSIEGSAITSVRIQGANHEFDSLDGVYEDITDIILNLKQLRIQYDGNEPITCRIKKSSEGPVTGADVQCPNMAQVVNRDLLICTLAMDRELEIEFEVRRGRGYVPADENRDEAQPLGTIPIDAIYSPVQRVRYSVEATRVGKLTNYDRLVVEVWTDGTVAPQMALIEAAKIYRKHLNPFVIDREFSDARPTLESPSVSEFNQGRRENSELQSLLDTSIDDLELSVRAKNCLDGADMHSVRDIVRLSENEMMNLKNLGKTSLTEIKSKLAELGLSLGMSAD